jgi:hypothetical protein
VKGFCNFTFSGTGSGTWKVAVVEIVFGATFVDAMIFDVVDNGQIWLLKILKNQKL